jgi:hypothetical protein
MCGSDTEEIRAEAGFVDAAIDDDDVIPEKPSLLLDRNELPNSDSRRQPGWTAGAAKSS